MFQQIQVIFKIQSFQIHKNGLHMGWKYSRKPNRPRMEQIKRIHKLIDLDFAWLWWLENIKTHISLEQLVERSGRSCSCCNGRKLVGL